MEFDATVIRYFGGDPSKRRLVTEEVFSEYSETWSLPDFLLDINEAAGKIPEELRSSAVVTLGSGDYDESSYLTIKYTRPETDAEVSARIERAHAYAREKEMGEREQLARLKAKYGA